MADLEYWKHLAQRRRCTISALEDRISDLEEELSDMEDVLDEHRSDLSFWRDVATGHDERWADKTELLKRIGELS